MVSIKHSVVIRTTPDRLYEALTTSHGLAAWWTPRVEHLPGVEDIFVFRFSQDYFKKMQVISKKHNKQVSWYCVEAHPEWVGTVITFAITSDAEGNCTLLFSHDDWKEYSPLFCQCSYDWAMFLRSLKNYQEKGTGYPFPSQHN